MYTCILSLKITYVCRYCGHTVVEAVVLCGNVFLLCEDNLGTPLFSLLGHVYLGACCSSRQCRFGAAWFNCRHTALKISFLAIDRAFLIVNNPQFCLLCCEYARVGTWWGCIGCLGGQGLFLECGSKRQVEVLCRLVDVALLRVSLLQEEECDFARERSK